MFSIITLGLFWKQSRYAMRYRVMDICLLILLALLFVLTSDLGHGIMLSCAGVSGLAMP